uniref:Uncharacterized protein n=1 Tax=Rhizophora mucronata TaxID=61149 RepID=A0A2P2NJP1_RHIMU
MNVHMHAETNVSKLQTYIHIAKTLPWPNLITWSMLELKNRHGSSRLEVNLSKNTQQKLQRVNQQPNLNVLYSLASNRRIEIRYQI